MKFKGIGNTSVGTGSLNSDNAVFIIEDFMENAPMESVIKFKEFMSKSVEEIQAERIKIARVKSA